ncbi:hypothetical protein RJ640_016636 [Escallonia rubra]|uniref:non-reducing end alpha-L-arabinofuranosidase n=1 Tax=Escallonia rubra TaxID=112253 RepID=A0AA88R5U3_9ASTE|nr:hypothetical protein RJ640_016636 [Escallonia rubra]
MGSSPAPCSVLICFFIGFCTLCRCSATDDGAKQTALLSVNASEAAARKMPKNLFGVFFEEINHAGAGGLWAELVQNRGFEAGGQSIPSNIYPWTIIGDESSLNVSTDLSSCFERNKVALRMEVLCDSKGNNATFSSLVMQNIEQGKTYKVVFYVRSFEPVHVVVSLTDSGGSKTLSTASITADNASKWTKVEALLEAKGTDHNSRLQLTTTRKGVIWFDQVSLMPLDTYKRHGFRMDLFKMVADLKPGFLRFPGGCFVEGSWLRNAVRWKETIGPWEERPGHFGDVWNYWTDDGLGHYEFLQVTLYAFLQLTLLAEDLGAMPIWVFNNGISHNDEVNTSNILPFVQEILDGIEFTRGDPDSRWGSVRAAMGHPEPFKLTHVAVGNEDCGKPNYRGNYLKFYNAIRRAYPDINIISNCDGSTLPLDHPADLYEYHTYPDANGMFSEAHHFDFSSRSGPKAFVSEYAVHGDNSGQGTLLGALAEAGFLIGLEWNSDVVAMASYAPLFLNENDKTWVTDAIIFNSYQLYGIPSYWMQYFFIESNGATLLNSTLQANSSTSLIASAITWQNTEDNKDYLRVKVVNFGPDNVNLKISIDGLEVNSKQPSGSTKTVLTSDNVTAGNSFDEPTKVCHFIRTVQNVTLCFFLVIEFLAL